MSCVCAKPLPCPMRRPAAPTTKACATGCGAATISNRIRSSWRTRMDPSPAARAGGVELRSIDYVQEHERHGKVSDQGRFWFLNNFQIFEIAIGFIGPMLGLSLAYTALAATLGTIIGTTCQA